MLSHRELCAVLQHGTVTARSTAAHLLGELADPRAVMPLLTALRDPHWQIRLAAIRALQLMRVPQHIGALLLALDTQESAVLRVQGLMAALQDAESIVRQAAAHALGQYRDVRAVDAVVHTLQDLEPEVRQHAADALGLLRDVRAIAALVQTLDDPEPVVVQEAAKALGSLGTAQAVPRLLALLADPSQPLDSHLCAVWALGALRAIPAVPVLIAALQSAESLVRAPPPRSAI